MDSKEEVYVECGSCSFRSQTVFYMEVVIRGPVSQPGQWELRNRLLKQSVGRACVWLMYSRVNLIYFIFPNNFSTSHPLCSYLRD